MESVWKNEGATGRKRFERLESGNRLSKPISLPPGATGCPQSRWSGGGRASQVTLRMRNHRRSSLSEGGNDETYRRERRNRETPENVFAYVTDASHLPEWQTSVVRVDNDDSPVRVGKRAVVTRQAGPRTFASTAEIAELVPPHRLGHPWRRRRGTRERQRADRTAGRRGSVACHDRTRALRPRRRQAASSPRREEAGRTRDAAERTQTQGAARSRRRRRFVARDTAGFWAKYLISPISESVVPRQCSLCRPRR